MDNLTVMEIVRFTIRVATYMEWYFAIWGCIGWGACLSLYAYHIKNGGKRWI